MVSECAGLGAMTSGHIDAGVSTRFVWITGWTPHPLLEQGSIVRESVAIWPEVSAPLSAVMSVFVTCPCPVHGQSASASVSVSSPRTRPQFVRVHAQSPSATCPRKRSCPVRKLTVTAIFPCPYPRHDRDNIQSVSCPKSQPIRVRDLTTSCSWLSQSFRQTMVRLIPHP